MDGLSLPLGAASLKQSLLDNGQSRPMVDGQARIGEDGRAAVGAKRNGHAFSVFVVG